MQLELGLFGVQEVLEPEAAAVVVKPEAKTPKKKKSRKAAECATTGCCDNPWGRSQFCRGCLDDHKAGGFKWCNPCDSFHLLEEFNKNGSGECKIVVAARNAERPATECATTGCCDNSCGNTLFCRGCLDKHKADGIKWCGPCDSFHSLEEFNKNGKCKTAVAAYGAASRPATPCEHEGCDANSAGTSAYCKDHFEEYQTSRPALKVSQAQKLAFLEYVDYGCQCCGYRMLSYARDSEELDQWAADSNRPYSAHPDYGTVEHIVPYSVDESLYNELSNLTMTRRSCNKGNGPFDERNRARLVELGFSESEIAAQMALQPVPFAEVAQWVELAGVLLFVAAAWYAPDHTNEGDSK